MCGKFIDSSEFSTIKQKAWFRFSNLGFGSWAKSSNTTNFTQPSLQLSLTPKVIGVYPSTGSTAGNLIWINVAGFGPNIAGLTIRAGQYVICTDIQSTSYSWISCLTNTGTLALKTLNILSSSGETYYCEGGCKYSQVSSATPIISGVSKPGANMVLAGSNFVGTTAANFQITFSGKTCTWQSSTATEVQCSLASQTPGQQNITMKMLTDAGSSG